MSNFNLTRQFKNIKNLKKTGELYEFNEAELTEEFILPIILSLGWDKKLHILEFVHCAVGIMDMVLNNNHRYKVILEAKRADQELENHKEQLYKYMAINKNVKLGILTNGHEWEFYLPRYYNYWRMKKFLEIDIGNSSLKQSKLNFIEYLYIDNILKSDGPKS